MDVIKSQVNKDYLRRSTRSELMGGLGTLADAPLIANLVSQGRVTTRHLSHSQPVPELTSSVGALHTTSWKPAKPKSAILDIRNKNGTKRIPLIKPPDIHSSCLPA
jgi:hypothetical protein